MPPYPAGLAGYPLIHDPLVVSGRNIERVITPERFVRSGSLTKLECAMQLMRFRFAFFATTTQRL